MPMAPSRAQRPAESTRSMRMRSLYMASRVASGGISKLICTTLAGSCSREKRTPS